MLELVVLAERAVTEAALEDPSAVLPDAPLALGAHGPVGRTGAGVRRQTLAAVTDPGLAVIAHRAHHGHARGVLAGVLDHAVAGLEHALDLAAFGALGQSLEVLAEVAEGAVLLLALALVALHRRVEGHVGQTALALLAPDLLLSGLLLLGLLPLPGLLLRHLD